MCVKDTARGLCKYMQHSVKREHFVQEYIKEYNLARAVYTTAVMLAVNHLLLFGGKEGA